MLLKTRGLFWSYLFWGSAKWYLNWIIWDAILVQQYWELELATETHSRFGHNTHYGNGVPQCLPLSVVELKVKHCRKPHCCNGVVDTFGPDVLTIFRANSVKYVHRFKEIFCIVRRILLQKVFEHIVYYGLCWHKMRNFASPFHFLGYCFTARVSLTLCARGASDCGQSFLMNEQGSSLHNEMETFLMWANHFFISELQFSKQPLIRFEIFLLFLTTLYLCGFQ